MKTWHVLKPSDPDPYFISHYMRLGAGCAVNTHALSRVVADSSYFHLTRLIWRSLILIRC
jgi:hypothetical protein